MMGLTVTDVFTYTLTDEDSDTSNTTATITITIVGVNAAPTAQNNSATVKENSTITVSNGDPNPLTAQHMQSYMENTFSCSFTRK